MRKEILIAILILVIILLLWKRSQANQPASTPPDQPDKNVLKLGSTGDAVKRLQRKLNGIIASYMNNDSMISGIFYNDNENGGMIRINILNVDGVFGTKTRQALVAITGSDKIATNQIDSIALLLI